MAASNTLRLRAGEAQRSTSSFLPSFLPQPAAPDSAGRATSGAEAALSVHLRASRPNGPGRAGRRELTQLSVTGGATADPRAASAPPPPDSLSPPGGRTEKARPAPRESRAELSDSTTRRERGTPGWRAPAAGPGPRAPLPCRPRGCGTPGPRRTGAAGRAGARSRGSPEPLRGTQNAAAARACRREAAEGAVRAGSRRDGVTCALGRRVPHSHSDRSAPTTQDGGRAATQRHVRAGPAPRLRRGTRMGDGPPLPPPPRGHRPRDVTARAAAAARPLRLRARRRFLQRSARPLPGAAGSRGKGERPAALPQRAARCSAARAPGARFLSALPVRSRLRPR